MVRWNEVANVLYFVTSICREVSVNSRRGWNQFLYLGCYTAELSKIIGVDRLHSALKGPITTGKFFAPGNDPTTKFQEWRSLQVEMALGSRVIY